MKTIHRIATFILLLAMVPRVGRGAAQIYLDVPAIPGPGSPQKYPTSMLVQSFAWAPKGNYFQVSRLSDSNTPVFQTYLGNGHVLNNVSALFYKTVNENHDPYLTFTFGDSFVSSLSFTVFDNIQKESIKFHYDTAKAIYLEIPDQPGDSSAPGHANIHSLDSFSFDSSGLTITKDVDAASPALAAAVANSTDFGSAELLFYDVPVGSNTPVDPPYDIMSLSDLTGAAYQATVGAVPNTEQITFSYSDFNDVPEPGTLGLLAAGIGAISWRRGNRKRSTSALVSP